MRAAVPYSQAVARAPYGQARAPAPAQGRASLEFLETHPSDATRVAKARSPTRPGPALLAARRSHVDIGSLAKGNFNRSFTNKPWGGVARPALSLSPPVSDAPSRRSFASGSPRCRPSARTCARTCARCAARAGCDAGSTVTFHKRLQKRSVPVPKRERESKARATPRMERVVRPGQGRRVHTEWISANRAQGRAKPRCDRLCFASAALASWLSCRAGYPSTLVCFATATLAP